MDHLRHTSSFMHTNLRWIIFDEADRYNMIYPILELFSLAQLVSSSINLLPLHLNRILELGFGKEIEEILVILGSRQNKSVSEENAVSKVSGCQRQNLLLSATLNEKVNHLAKISLENPVMIGIDDKKMQANPLQEHIGSLESGVEDALEHSGTMLSASNEEYKLPAQLVQRYIKGSVHDNLI